MSHMELALDPGDRDLLGFLLEESGGLVAAPDEALEAPLGWELPLFEVGRGLSRGGPGPVVGCVPEAVGGDRLKPVNLNPMQALSNWDVEDFLSCLPSPPAPLTVFSNSNPCLVHHDHTYSLSREHVSIDLGKSVISEVLGEERTHGPGYSYFPFFRY